MGNQPPRSITVGSITSPLHPPSSPRMGHRASPGRAWPKEPKGWSTASSHKTLLEVLAFAFCSIPIKSSSPATPGLQEAGKKQPHGWPPWGMSGCR